MRFAAALLCLAVASVSLTSAAPCASGSGGDECRTQCALKCNGHTGCDVDACGLLTCDCSGHGDIDAESGKCVCDLNRNPSDMAALDCDVHLDNTDCVQGQQVGTQQPPIPYAFCNVGIALCINGATLYSNGSLNSGVQRTEACNPPLIGPFSFSSLNPTSTSYLGVFRGAQYEMALRDIGGTVGSPIGGDAPLMWFVLERRHIYTPIYTIHSAFDRNRTLEIVTIAGALAVQLSARRLESPTLWYIPTSPVLFNSFGIYSNADRTLHLAYTTSITSYGQYKLTLLTAAQQASALQWFVNVPQSHLTSVSGAGFSYTGSGAVSLRPAFDISDPLACLDHCRRDSLCKSASYVTGQCVMLSTAGVAQVAGASDRGWVLNRPFFYNGMPTLCLNPALGTDCEPLAIGHARLQSGGESVALQQDNSVVSVTMATKGIGWTNRGGTLASPPRGVTGSPNWRFVNVDNGNEWIIFPQGSGSFVLGVVSGSTVGLVAYAPSAPVTWFRVGASTFRSPTGTNSTISDEFRFVLSSNPQLRLGSLTANPTQLSVAVSTASFAVSTFRWSFNENDPFGTNNVRMNTDRFESRFGVSLLHCFSGCSMMPRCRAISWNSDTFVCNFYGIAIGSPYSFPNLATTNWTSVSKSYGDHFYGTSTISNGVVVAGPNCANGAFNLTDSQVRYVDLYSYREPSFEGTTNRITLAQHLYPPVSYCVTPASLLIQISLQRNLNYLARNAHGGGVFASLRDTTGFAYDGWAFSFRFTMDGAGVFEIYSGANPLHTLEIERSGLLDRDSDAELFLVLRDNRPNQPARWRCRGWPAACNAIESFEEPGRFVKLCSSFTTVGLTAPFCATHAVTYDQIVATSDLLKVDSLLNANVQSSTSCLFQTGDVDAAFTRTMITHDYQMCVGAAARRQSYNGIIYDSATRICTLYKVNTFTSFLTGAPATFYCQTLTTIEQISLIAGSTCGIQGYPGASFGCTGPTTLPNVNLTNTGTLGTTSFSLIATGPNNNAYVLCAWNQGAFTQTVDPGGITGTTFASSAIAYFPTSCLTYDETSGAVYLESTATTAPASFLLGGIDLTTPRVCTFSSISITVNRAGATRHLVYSATANPAVSAKTVGASEIAGHTLEWKLWYNHCTQMHSSYQEAAVLDVIPDFYGEEDDYMVERFYTTSVLDCQGRAIDNLLVGGFVYQPGAIRNRCSLYSNFGYLLRAIFGQTSMTSSPGTIAWRRGNLAGTFAAGTQHVINTDPLYPMETGIGPTTDADPQCGTNCLGGSFQFYFPWAKDARGYGQFSSRMGTFCGGGTQGHGVLHVPRPLHSVHTTGISMTNAVWPVMKYLQCSPDAKAFWFIARDFANDYCVDPGIQGLASSGDCVLGGDGILMVPGTERATAPYVYVTNTFVLNAIMLSGGSVSESAPKPGAGFAGSVAFTDGLWMALTLAPHVDLDTDLGVTPPDANRKVLCVFAHATDSGFVEPIYEFRDINRLVDGFGRSFARLNTAGSTASMSSFPRDCMFQLQNTGALL